MDRPDSSSSDDDDDRQNLIDQNERKRLPSPRSATTTFHIDDGDVDHHRHHREIRRRFASLKLSDLFNKRFLIFFIFVLILFFTTDIKSLFFSRLSVPLSDSLSDKLRESELRALFLLRQQQLGLFGLWNQTHPNSTSNHSNSELLDFKSSISRQISLNKEIQQVLLSPHSFGNSSLESGDFRDPSLGDRCGVVGQRFSERRTIEWKPNSDKYLLAICVSGQMSNHLISLEKHMFFAALKWITSTALCWTLSTLTNALGEKLWLLSRDWPRRRRITSTLIGSFAIFRSRRFAMWMMSISRS